MQRRGKRCIKPAAANTMQLDQPGAVLCQWRCDAICTEPDASQPQRAERWEPAAHEGEAAGRFASCIAARRLRCSAQLLPPCRSELQCLEGGHAFQYAAHELCSQVATAGEVELGERREPYSLASRGWRTGRSTAM